MDEHGVINAIIFQCLNSPIKDQASYQLLVYNAVIGFFFIGLLIVVTVIMKTIKIDCDKDTSNCNDSYCHKLKEHDFKYCIGILFLVIVFICTLTLGNNSKVMEYFSFAGTVSSLILSVLAIIMTILSEYKNEGTKASMENMLKQTAESVKEIRKFTDSMNATSQSLYEYGRDINQMKADMNEIKKIAMQVNNISDILREFKNKNDGSSDSSDKIDSLKINRIHQTFTFDPKKYEKKNRNNDNNSNGDELI